ncbi:hypothetical protein [Sorangium sp. So ce341]|uniref:hypothetical protein n=1 Tax=Sorangium sp. So ce341 TaxID=3133302 RepID=UPI003F5D91D2
MNFLLKAAWMAASYVSEIITLACGAQSARCGELVQESRSSACCSGDTRIIEHGCSLSLTSAHKMMREKREKRTTDGTEGTEERKESLSSVPSVVQIL